MRRVDKVDDFAGIAQELKKGKMVVSPTDTVYGLLVDATNRRAVKKVFQVKGREKGKSLPVFVKNIAMAKRFAHVSKEQEKFLKNVWPGKVTVVLKSRKKLPKELELNGKVALRIPDYTLINLLLGKIKRPLTGTSANVSGEPSCFSAVEVIAQFQKRKYQPDIVLNAGALRKAKSSRVIDITEEGSKVIRK